MDEELLPCPFCGGNAHLEPELYSDENASEVIGPASVSCMNCGAAIWGDWSDDALTAWNRRPTPTDKEE